MMAYRQEEQVADIVHRSNILRGRQPWKREEGLTSVAADEMTAEIGEKVELADAVAAASGDSQVA